MRILYISFFYPPFNSIGGLRAYGQVKALREAGCEVKVITCSDQGFEVDNRDSYEDLDTDTFYIDLLNGSPRESSGLRNTIKKVIINLPRFFNRYFYLLNYLFFGEYRNWSKEVKIQYRRILGTWKPDIIFSSQSPISSHEVASDIALETDTNWVAEFRDSWSFNPMAFSKTQKDLSSIIMRRIEKRILKNCSLIVSATSFIQSYYDRYHDIESYLLYGGWDESLSTKTIPRSNSKIQITHLGSMLYGRRSITPIIKMLNRNNKILERYEFQFIGRHTSFFTKQLEGNKAKDSIILKELIPYVQAEKFGYSTDILLLIMMDSPQERFTLTGKIFDYIKYQKPILIVDPHKSEAYELVNKYKMGHVFEKYSDLESFLEQAKDINSFKRICDENRSKFKRTIQVYDFVKYLNKKFIS